MGGMLPAKIGNGLKKLLRQGISKERHLISDKIACLKFQSSTLGSSGSFTSQNKTACRPTGIPALSGMWAQPPEPSSKNADSEHQKNSPLVLNSE